MKTTLFLAVFICSYRIVFCQDIHEPTPMTFNHPQVVDSNYQYKFFYSWNWLNGPEALNKRYKMNAFHTFDTFNNGWTFPANPTNYSTMPDSLSLMWRLFNVCDDNKPLDALAMMWYPWLPPSSSNDDFTPFHNDKTGASLPFLSRVDSVGSLDSTTSSGATIYRWKLKKNPLITTLVSAFSKPWLGNEFIYRNLGIGQLDSIPFTNYDLYNSRQLHLSINLRRTGTDTLTNSDTLLVLKMPYRSFNGSTGYIAFDSIPNPISLVSTSRGQYRKTTFNTSANLTNFVIRRSMLPRSDAANPDITLNAVFFADNDTVTHAGINPRFNCRWCGGTGNVIDTIGIEATYIPSKSSVAIRWIKMETPNAQRAYFGGYDTVMKAEVNRTLDSLNRFNTIWGKHHKVFRFYAREEFLASEWQSVRYFNLLVDTLATTEYGVTHRAHEDNTMLFRENWNGSTYVVSGSTPAPYLRETAGIYDADASQKRLGVANRDGNVLVWHPGVGGNGIEHWHNDYEAAFRGMPHEISEGASAWSTDSSKIYSLPLPPMSDSAYQYNILRSNGLSSTYSPPSFLQGIDIHLWNNRYYSNNSYIFTSKPWWGNIWASNVFKYNYISGDTASAFHFRTMQAGQFSQRPFTGEELRYSMWNCLILGAKGFHVWEGGGTDYLSQMFIDTSSKTYDAFLSLAPTGGSFTMSDSAITTNTNLILDDPDIGTDYLDTVGGRNDKFTQTFRKYFKYSDSTYHAAMGMDRIYLGFKSQRWAVDEVFSHTRKIDTTLMNLQLVSWFAKSIRKQTYGDMSLLLKFIDTTLYTDTVTREFASTRLCDGFKESWDSAFYDVTVHTHKFYDPNKVIFIAVQNRRTNSLVKSGSDTTWLTAKEFKDSVFFTTRQQYEQFGSRELQLPFNYKDSNGRYAMLHITELGGGIDTIIGQDRAASVKLLPGEGKFLKVEVIQPNEVAGNLAHSNQTKIVAHAKMKRHNGTGAWEESDTLVHYMTYFKPINSDTNYTGVYFRKSKPATKYMNTAAIQWDSTEYLLSKNVFHDSIPSICDTCAYPSIVTRFDSTSGEYWSFVVYGCKSDSSVKYFYKQYIVESVARVKNDTVCTFTRNGYAQYGLVLDSVDNRDLKEWGTPMVNASDSANFYCWSKPDEFDKGIHIAWKKPDSIPRSFVSKNWLTWSYHNYLYVDEDCELTGVAQHPSMNPYSRYIRGEHENDCALVWQEKNNCDYPDLYFHSHIFYTRLWIDDGQITYGLSPNYMVDIYNPSLLKNSLTGEGSIVCMSTTSDLFRDSIEYTYPVVVRELFLADTNSDLCDFGYWGGGHTPVDVRFDGVYWQMQQSKSDSSFIGAIMSRWIWQQDTIIGGSFVRDTFTLGYIAPVWGGSASGIFYDQPVISCGEADYYRLLTGNWVGCVNYSTRQFSLEFRKRPLYPSMVAPFWTAPDSLAQILHLNITHHPVGVNTTVEIVDNGYLSDNHVAERGTDTYNDWQRNHRIYNKAIPSPPALPTIRSSGQYFFRTENTQPSARQFYGFGEMESSFGVSSVIIGEKEYAIKPDELEQPMRFFTIPDTLSTDWFNVGNVETMGVITAGSSPVCLNIWLERQSDGATWDVPLSAGEQMRITSETVELENGDNESYRVRVSSNNHAPYHPETAITDDNEVSSFSKPSGQEYKQINLGDSNPMQTVFVYPNPARDEVNLLIKGTEKSEVIIVSAIGGEQTRFVAEGGKTAILNTSNFSSGVYVARVRRKGMVDAVVPFVVVR